MEISHDKIVTFDEMVTLASTLKQKGQRIVMAPGCFDFFHVGHLHHLKQAKRLGDVLIISLTPDCYVGKGPNRPIYTQHYRAEILAALDIVDYIFINHYPNQGQTLQQIKPDIFVVGNEYRQAGTDTLSNPEERIAAELTGAVIVFTDDRIFSSTQIIEEYFREKK